MCIRDRLKFKECLALKQGARDHRGLTSDSWIRQQAALALEHGHQPSQRRLDSPMRVMGVGAGEQQCQLETTVPIALPRADGTHTLERFTAPAVPDSELPALLGLRSLMRHRAIVDTANRQLWLCGPGPIKIGAPPRGECYQLEQTQSGHLLLPATSMRHGIVPLSGTSLHHDPWRCTF